MVRTPRSACSISQGTRGICGFTMWSAVCGSASRPARQTKSIPCGHRMGAAWPMGRHEKGTLDVYQRASTSAGQEEALLEGPGSQYLTSWSPDGRFLMYFNGTGGSPRTLQDSGSCPSSEHTSRRHSSRRKPLRQTVGFLRMVGGWCTRRMSLGARKCTSHRFPVLAEIAGIHGRRDPPAMAARRERAVLSLAGQQADRRRCQRPSGGVHNRRGADAI